MPNGVVRVEWNAIKWFTIFVEIFLDIDAVRIVLAHFVQRKNVQKYEHNQYQWD